MRGIRLREGAAGLAAAVVVLVAAVASGQTDPSALAASCVTELERAQQAAEGDDSGVAMVLLDMAGETCRTARDGLLAAVGEDTESSAATLIYTTLWQMELRHVRLLTSMAQCQQAREALQRVANQARLPVAVELDFARVAHEALGCGPRAGAPTGGTISVSPGMLDQYFSGVIMGEQEAGLLSSECWGWLPASPTYRVEVIAPTQVSLSAYSGGDLVMAVTGPSGTFCNDDYDGLNPAISQYFSAGTYDVYIGEYSRSGYGQDFSLTVSTNPLWISPSYTYPTYGEVYLGPGYGRTTLSGSVWGMYDAAVMHDPSCVGWIAENPDFRMYVDASAETWVTVTGTSGADLALVVRGPSGTICVDDTHGMNPQLHQTLMTGSYDVWIADKAGMGTGASYGVQFSAYDPMLVLATDPLHGEARLGPTDGPVTLSGSVAGVIPASDFFGSSCYGSIGTGPSHRLTVTADAMVEIVARSSGYADLVIAITGPTGTFCNDDYDGLNPGVRRWLSAGVYLVYVGELSASGAATPFVTTITPSVGTPPPDPSRFTTGRFGSVTVGYGLGTTTHSGTSGGPRAAEEIEASCRGYITEEPSFVMQVNDYVYTTLRVMSEGDTTMVVMGPDGVTCNDDYHGLNPGLDQYLSPGRYGVWIGSYSAGAEFPFMMTFSGEGY
jgi:hypothetical protein